MKIMHRKQYFDDYNKAVDIFNERISQLNDEFDMEHPEIKNVRDDPDGPNWTVYRKFISERIDPLIERLNFKLNVNLMFDTIEAVKLI